MKSIHYSKNHNRLHRARNNVAFFLTCLSPVRQGKEIWDTFLVKKKTQAYPPSLPEHEFFDQQKRKSSVIGCIFPENFTSPNKSPNVSPKMLTVQQ